MCAIALLILVLLIVCFIKRNKGGKYPGTDNYLMCWELSDVDGRLLDMKTLCGISSERERRRSPGPWDPTHEGGWWNVWGVQVRDDEYQKNIYIYIYHMAKIKTNSRCDFPLFFFLHILLLCVKTWYQTAETFSFLPGSICKYCIEARQRLNYSILTPLKLSKMQIL